MTNDFAAVSTLVAEFQRKLNVLIQRDNSRDIMAAHLPLELVGILEDDVVPALDAAMACIEWELELHN
jgi:hypothetical protein